MPPPSVSPAIPVCETVPRYTRGRRPGPRRRARQLGAAVAARDPALGSTVTPHPREVDDHAVVAGREPGQAWPPLRTAMARSSSRRSAARRPRRRWSVAGSARAGGRSCRSRRRATIVGLVVRQDDLPLKRSRNARSRGLSMCRTAWSTMDVLLPSTSRHESPGIAPGVNPWRRARRSADEHLRSVDSRP
jgi:hypothetical protein